MDISKKILSDPVNKWVFSNAGTEVFLVGGYIRDLLQGYITADKDFVLGFGRGEKNTVENFAIKAAKKFKGTFVSLKPEKTYRVVLNHKETLDFSAFNVSINNDLKKRDFTVNAIAWTPETGIIDSVGGIKDLKNHIIRAVRMKNLANDPLRVIRAYRIAAEQGFKIEHKTRRYLRHYSKRLDKVASERITEEFFKILSNENAVKYLNKCYKDVVLEKILPKRMQDIIKKTDSMSKRIKILNKLDLFLFAQLKRIKKSSERKKIIALLKQEINQELNSIGLIRLSMLVDIGAGDAILYGRLKVSNIINKAVSDIHNGCATATRKIPDTKMYETFNSAGKSVFETAILLSFIKRRNIKFFFKRANEYMRVKNKILLNGNDIQKILKLKPGIKIGKILANLKQQQFKGIIKTRAGARKWLLCNFT